MSVQKDSSLDNVRESVGETVIPVDVAAGNGALPKNGDANSYAAGADRYRKAQTERKSYQMRALGRKTLSYQKRQMFTNICCISCCPLLMVVISSILGKVIQGLIDKQQQIMDVVFCSNLPALNNVSFPIFNLSDPAVPTTPRDSIVGAKQDKVYHVNFQLPPGQYFAAGSAASALGGQQPCVMEFTKFYPTTGGPYGSDPQIGPNEAWTGLDSTYTHEPRRGWLSPSSSPPLARSLLQWQLRPWLLYSLGDGVDPALIGTRPGPATVPINDVIAGLNSTAPGPITGFPTNSTNGVVRIPFVPASQAGGLLGTIEWRLAVEAETTASGAGGPGFGVQGVTPVPYYNLTAGNTPESLDDALGNAIRAVIDRLATIDKHVLFDTSPSDTDVAGFLVNASIAVKNMPYGAIYFREINHPAKTYKYTLQIANDLRLSRGAGFPPQGLRQVLQQSQLGNAFRSFIGRILFPFGLSFLLPIFVIIIVKEKEDRILIMMQMNGLKTWTYWLTHYVHFYVLHVLSSAVFLIVGRVMRLEFFTRTDPGLLIVMFFLWGHVQVALALFFATFFSKNRTALVIVFLIVLCGVIVSLATDQLFGFTAPAPKAYLIWPPFAFYRVLSVVNTAAFSRRQLRPYTMSRVVPGDEVFTAFMFLIVEIFVFLAAAFYAQTVIKSEFGVARKWYWPIQHLLGKGKKKEKERAVAGSDEEIGGSNQTLVRTEELNHEDDDVRAERLRVLSNAHSPASPLIMRGMRKVYQGRSGRGEKLAVKDVTLAVEENVVFGLLGPNGAGKTTLISILTGLYEATEGEATLAGYNIMREKESVYKVIGVCPQHDILWEDLTVEEHLLFYARLKGVHPSKEKAVVEASMRTVQLNGAFASRLSKGLSGGEKRRLSIAIALVGEPAVVFLDEPTTGLDPEVRRLIWNIINQAREGKTIILTTHSMEEAEVLCQRIGIMAKGTLRCLGSQLRLKDLYGSGFKLFFSARPESVATASAYIESLLPPGNYTKLDSFAANTSYEFTNEKGLVGRVFEEVESHKGEVGILDWGLSQTTLEEVFVRIISDAEAEAD
ncbi:hypothetical protein HK104_000723 [Borealophlyctis nickersoniae]|nr:hypothetical protein HK104_000723 [Borealophlyctis nickersoniae]